MIISRKVLEKLKEIKDFEIADLAVRRNGKVLVLIKRDGRYDFPGGKRENDESPLETVVREIKEELNCKIKCIEDVIVKDDWIIFIGDIDGQIRLSDEHKDYLWISIENINVISDKNLKEALKEILNK